MTRDHPEESTRDECSRTGLDREDQTARPERLAEVEDFVDFLRARDDEQRLKRAAAKATEASSTAVWDNDEDAACDRK